MQTDAGPVTLNVWTSAVGPDREAQKTEAELQIAQRQATTRNDLYQYSWFSEQFAHYRRIAVKAWLASNIANTLIAWICLALAYGGYYYMNRLHGLKIYVVDLDNNYLGTQIVNAFQASLSQPNHFSLIFDTAFTSNEQVQEAVYDEKAWGAVVVNPGATHNLQQALASGNASYDPTSAVMLITEGARNVLTSGSHVVPGLEALLQPALTQAAENQTASFLAANVANTAALQTALKCPQCLSNGFAYTPNDLRPAYDAAALGTGLSAAIALIVFTFAVSGSQNQIGIAIGEHLSIPSTIVFRLVTCMTAYLFISLSITGVQAAFGVPTTTPFGGRGFVILWMLNWMSVSAFGLMVETIVTVCGFWVCNWVLNFFVFFNSAGSSYSNEIMPAFYKYDYGFPLVHSIRGTTTIIYGTKSHLGTNFGVLIGWVVGCALAISVGTYVRLRWNMRQGSHVLP